MSISSQDLEAFAARIRPHFEPELRDVAYDLALRIARVVGAQVKLLRPETRMVEIFEWFREQEPFPASLDQVEFVMALEVEMGFEVSDEFAGKLDARTFRDLVVELARKRRAA